MTQLLEGIRFRVTSVPVNDLGVKTCQALS